MHRYDYAKALLIQGDTVELEAFGQSMVPTITSGSILTLIPFHKHQDSLHLYDIVFVCVEGVYYLHRVIELIPHIMMKGDHDQSVIKITKDDIYGIYIDPLYTSFKYYLENKPIIKAHQNVLNYHELHMLDHTSLHSKKMQMLMMLQQEAVDKIQAMCVTYGVELLILKGYALDAYYEAYPYLRTKGDFDVFVLSGHKLFEDILTTLGYTYHSHNTYHKVYKSHHLQVEVHHELGVDLTFNRSDLIKEKPFMYMFNQDMTYVYLLLHVKKHLKHGGIGFKHVMDFYMMDRLHDHEVLKRYGVHMLYLYIMSIFDLMFGKTLSPLIDKESLYYFMEDIKSYGVHGQARIRLTRMKGTHVLYQRYVKDTNRFKHLKQTLRQNSLSTLMKKLMIYIKATPQQKRKTMYRHLEVL